MVSFNTERRRSRPDSRRKFRCGRDQGARRSVETDRSLQAELTAKGIVFNKPGPVQFRAVLVKAGYGADAWAQLDKIGQADEKSPVTPARPDNGQIGLAPAGGVSCGLISKAVQQSTAGRRSPWREASADCKADRRNTQARRCRIDTGIRFSHDAEDVKIGCLAPPIALR
jgi:hypothetical protein